MTENQWIAFGLFGQLLFGGRFLMQWIASEKAKRSVVPISFWYLSIGGSSIVLSYGFHRLDPVIILGQLMGFVIYIRNLILLAREGSHEDDAVHLSE
jgi:lipid-A-disaccharide synthase-like uncharacterized protein